MCLPTLCLLLLAGSAVGQIKEERRYGVRYNTELYSQGTPSETLASLLRTVEKDRYDYMAAFLLDPMFVADQLKISKQAFDKAAGEQVDGETLDRKGFDATYIRNRKRDLAAQMNFENLVARLKSKLEQDPETLKELSKIYRDGEFKEGADATSARHPEIKGKVLFFRNINGRWYIENKMIE